MQLIRRQDLFITRHIALRMALYATIPLVIASVSTKSRLKTKQATT